MPKIKITQVKSTIDRPKSQKDTMLALGIKKTYRSVIVETSPAINGMVKKVQHLVTVEEVKN